MNPTTPQQNTEGWEEKIVHDFANGLALQLKPSNDTMEAIRLLRKELPSLLLTARREERALMKEIIEECGHQQDDDSIWCNMDDLLKRLSALSPHTPQE